MHGTGSRSIGDVAGCRWTVRRSAGRADESGGSEQFPGICVRKWTGHSAADRRDGSSAGDAVDVAEDRYADRLPVAFGTGDKRRGDSIRDLRGRAGRTWNESVTVAGRDPVLRG